MKTKNNIFTITAFISMILFFSMSIQDKVHANKFEKKSFEQLIKILKTKKNWNNIDLAIWELGKRRNPKAVPYILEIIRDKRIAQDEVMSGLYFPVIERFPSEKTVRQLIALAQDPKYTKYNLGIDLSKTIAKMEKHNAFALCLAEVKNKNPITRIIMLSALGQMKNKGAVKPINAALDDKHSWVRSAAAETLGRRFEYGSIQKILNILTKNDSATTTTSVDKTVIFFTISPRSTAKSLSQVHFALKKLKHDKLGPNGKRSLKMYQENVKQGIAEKLKNPKLSPADRKLLQSLVQ